MLATALLAAGALAPPASLARVKSLLATGVARDDADLGAAIANLIKEAPQPARVVDFKRTTGAWRVVHAPHIDTLSKLALTKFSPIEYLLDENGGITSNVKYESSIFGSGWLCTDGSVVNEPDGDTAQVKIVWDRIWWAPTAADAPPPAPHEGALRELVQAIGKAGFIEPLSIFPVRYVGEDLAAFNFQSFTVTAQRTAASTPPPSASAASSAADASDDGRLSSSSLLGLAAFGGGAGPLVDAVHNQALLTYDVLPVSLPLGLGVAKTSALIPLLLAPSYVLLGAVLPAAVESVLGRGRLEGVPLGRACTTPLDFLEPGARAALAVGSTILIIKLSEILVAGGLSTAASLAILFTACAAQWAVLDGAWASLALALAAAVGGPLAELPLMKLGLWHYIEPDYFPLRAVFGEASDAWAGLAGVTGPCYFAVTTDAIALGRWLGGRQSNDMNA